MKKILATLLAVLMIASLVACGAKTEEAPAPAPAATEAPAVEAPVEETAPAADAE